jgi:hypothetical protein
MAFAVMSDIEIGAGSKEAGRSDNSANGPLETAPKGSQPKFTPPPTQTAARPQMLGWVVASMSVFVGFVIIAAATRIAGARADNRGANSSIPQQTNGLCQIIPVPRKHVIHRAQNQNAVSTRQQNSLSEGKETLYGKKVRKHRPSTLEQVSRQSSRLLSHPISFRIDLPSLL